MDHSKFILYFLLIVFCLKVQAQLRFASVFQDRMVLQREPESAVVFGFGALFPESEAVLSCAEDRATTRKQSLSVVVGEDGTWRSEIPPQTAGTGCDISFINGEEEISLKQVIFGDVWLCSGQSNMAFFMRNIFNATEEIAMSAPYTDIRFSVMSLVTSDQEELDLEPKFGWTDSSDNKVLSYMSAVCFLFARNIYDVTGVPMGLIDSSWGGTRIEAWSSSEALEACDIPGHVNEEKPQESNSNLWNAMIAPLKQMSLKGFLWYQGEANSHWNSDQYNCTFPTLIDSWRNEFSSNSFTSPMAPFGFVQLSTIKYDHDNTYPLLRWHQTADYGFVPNPRMEKVFMAVAVDTYDEENGIHPRYKQIIGERLAFTGLNVAYGLEEFPEHGPQVTDISLSDSGLILTYHQEIVFNNEELSGFYICCQDAEYSCYDSHIYKWQSVPSSCTSMTMTSPTQVMINQSCWTCDQGVAPSLAYLWRETPINTPIWGAPVYGADMFSLPAPPFIRLASDIL